VNLRRQHISSWHSRYWPTALAALLLTFVRPAWAADTPALPTQSVRVNVAISRDGQASIQEYYRFTSQQPMFQWQYLGGSCAFVGPVAIASGGGTVRYAIQQKGPWVYLTPAAPSQEATEYSVSYTTQLAGRLADIPLVMPAASLESSQGYGASIVALQLVFPQGSGESAVVLPQMRSGGPASWSGGLLAIPSFLRVRLGSAISTAPCSESPARGSSGSLEWWICAFAGTLVVWVVLYMRWAKAQ
jgi:hypothetical protein